MLGGVLRSFTKPVSVVIEEADKSDFSNLADVHRQGFVHGWSDGELAKLAAKENYKCLVARKKGAADKPPLAFIVIRSAADEAEVITIATKKSARRKGIGRQLIEAAIRLLQAERAVSLFLEVDEKNVGAIALYTKLGFRKVGERQGYYASNGQENPSTALVMQRDLG